MLQIPILTKAISALTLAAFMFISGLLNLTSPQQFDIQINTWDGNSAYYSTLNNKDIIIYLETTQETTKPPVKKKKETTTTKTKDKNKDIENQTENSTTTETEYNIHHETPGKIKIVFRDDPKNGTNIIYERDIGSGEIPTKDQEYIERILTNIENFHKENRTYNRVKEKVDGFWNLLKKKK